MINTVIFDLDGTLLNTLEDLTDSVNFAMEKMGVPLHTIEEVRMMVGNSVNYLIEKALPEGSSAEEINRCIEVFENHYHDNMRNKTAPYDGIIQMLSALKAKGYKMAVVSNKSDGFTKALVKDFFGEFITQATGRSADIPRKPAPDSVLRTMSVLDSESRETVYVGDSEVDVMTARNAGVPCIGCLWGFRDEATLKAEGAAAIISEPTKLLEAIEKL